MDVYDVSCSRLEMRDASLFTNIIMGTKSRGIFITKTRMDQSSLDGVHVTSLRDKKTSLERTELEEDFDRSRECLRLVDTQPRIMLLLLFLQFLFLL